MGGEPASRRRGALERPCSAGSRRFAQDAGVPVMLAEAQASLGRWDDLIQAALPTVDAPA